MRRQTLRSLTRVRHIDRTYPYIYTCDLISCYLYWQAYEILSRIRRTSIPITSSKPNNITYYVSTTTITFIFNSSKQRFLVQLRICSIVFLSSNSYFANFEKGITYKWLTSGNSRTRRGLKSNIFKGIQFYDFLI